MQRLLISMVMDLSDEAPSGAGWYVRAYADGNSMFEPVAISSEAAYEASRALQEAMQSTEAELPQLPLPQLVESGTKLIKNALEEQLRKAEEMAARIAGLRKKLAKVSQEQS